MADELPSEDQILQDLSQPAASRVTTVPTEDQIVQDLSQPQPHPSESQIMADLSKPAAKPPVVPPIAPQPIEEPDPDIAKARAVYKGQLKDSLNKLQAADTSDKKTFVDVGDTNPNDIVPFLSGIHQAADFAKLYQAAKRLKSGESQPEDTNVDYQLIKQFLQEQKDNQKPQTFGYKFLNTLINIPAFAAELMLTAGTFRAGKAITQEALLKAAEKFVEGAAEKKAVQIGAKVAGTAAGSAIQTAAARAPDVAGGLVQRLTPTVQFTPDEAGKLKAVVEDPQDGFAKAMAKSFGNEFVEVFTEHTGGAISAALNKIPGAQRLAAIKEAVLAKWLGKQKGSTKEVIARLARLKNEAAWDGLIGEMGEEQLGDILKPLLGVTPEYQQHIQSWSDLAAEAAAFAVPGAAEKAALKVLGLPGEIREGKARAEHKANLEELRQTPEYKQGVAERGKQIERQDLTDAIMQAGAAKPGATNEEQNRVVQSGVETPPVGQEVQSQTQAQSVAPGQEISGDIVQPTPAQAEAGNYKKPKVNFQGLPISIETPKGGTRSGTDKSGNPWSVTMPADYGYIRRTEGKDGDHVDVYVGPNPDSQQVFVVDQKDPENHKFDEHKTFVGFDSPADALAAYQAAFSDGSGAKRIKGMATMSIDEFKDWLKNGDTKKTVETAVKKQQTPSGQSRDVTGFGRPEKITDWEQPAAPVQTSAPKVSIKPAKSAVSVPVSQTWKTMTPPAPGRKSVKASGTWDVIDASEVGDLGGITELQARNRYGMASREQIEEIAKKLNTDMTGDSVTTLEGAPFIDEKGERLAGYGRLAGYKLAYDHGLEPAKKYKQWVVENAGRLGLGDKVKGMTRPILVRRALSFEGGSKEEFADLSNASPSLEFTPAELARNDAKVILEKNLLNVFAIDENGNISKQFKDLFYNAIKERSGLRETNGAYRSAMDTRIQTAILTALLEKSKNEKITFLVRAAVERGPALSIMPQINGMVEAAPRLLELAAKHPDFDISGPLAQALVDFVEYRRRVVSGYDEKIDEFMNQLDLFEQGRSAESGLILDQLGRLKSVKAVSEYFSRYADAAEKESKNSQTADLFSGEVEKQSAAQLLGKARNETANVGGNGGQGSEGTSTNPNATGAGGGGEARGGKADFVRSERSGPGQTAPGANAGLTNSAEKGNVGNEDANPGSTAGSGELPLPGGEGNSAHAPGAAGEVEGSETDHSLDPIIEASGGSVRHVLAHIELNSSSRFYRLLAKLLRKLDPQVTVRQTTLAEANKQFSTADGHDFSEGTQAAYSPSRNLVMMFPAVNQEKSFLHEVVHAVSILALKDQKAEFYQKVKLLFDVAHKAGMTGYGMTNVQEFVAEAFTTPEFQDQLMTLKAQGNLWERFVDAVRRLIGLKEKYSNAFHQLVKVSIENFQPDSDWARGPPSDEVHKSVAWDTEAAQAAVTTNELRSPAALEAEARGISGQVTGLRRMVEKFIPSGVEDNILRAALHNIGYDEIFATSELVNGIIDPEELTQGIERLKDSPLLGTYRKEAGMRFKFAKTKMENAIADYEAKIKEVTSDAFQERVANKSAEAEEHAWLGLAQKYFDADVARLMTELKTLAETEANNQGRAEGIYAQLKHNMAKAGYTEAVKATIRSIVETFAKHEAKMGELDSLRMLYDSTPADVQVIIDTYRRLKVDGLPDETIIRWAAEMLTRAKEITRNLLALEAVKQNEKVRRHYDTLVTTIFDEWKKSPGKTSKKIVKAISKFATDAEKARAAYAAIHREFTKEAKELDVLETAADIARKFLDDQDTKDYEKLAYEGVIQDRGGGEFLNQDPDALRLEQGITLPDGTNTGPIRLEGDVVTFTNTFQRIQQAADQIQQWLENNPERIEGEYWRAMLEHLDKVLLTSRVWSPAKVRSPVRQFGPWGMMEIFSDMLGTREGGRLKVAAQNFNKAEDAAKTLYFENWAKLTNQMTTAAKSHGYKGKLRYSLWYQNIGRELIDSWQNKEGGYEKGYKIKGEAVTAEDMALIKMMANLAGQGFDIVQRGILRGREGVVSPVWFRTDLGDTGIEMHVQSTKVTKHTVPRTFNPEAIRFVDKWQQSTPQQKIEMLDSAFSDVVMSYLRDRSNTLFDGASPHEQAYRVLADEIDENGLEKSNRNMNWLVGKIAEIESPGPNETEEQQHARITADILGEFDKQNKRISDYFAKKKGEENVRIETIEQRSSFTKARGDKLAGYWLYNTGWKDGNAFSHFIHAIHGYYYMRAAQALDRVKDDLLRMKGDLDQKMRMVQLETGLAKADAAALAVKTQADMVEKGKTYDDYRELDKKLGWVTSLSKDFASIYGDEGRDPSLQLTKLRRVFSAVGLSALMSVLTGMRNVGYGWVKQGRMMSKYEGTFFSSYPKAFYEMWIRTMVPLALSTVVSTVKAVPMAAIAGARIGVATPVGIARGLYNKAQGRGFYQGKSGLQRGPAAALGRFIAPLLTEMTQTLFERGRLNREMFDMGIVPRSYASDEYIAKAQNLTEGGVIRETPLYTSMLGNMVSAAIGLYDSLVLTPIGKPNFPRWFDIGLNRSGILGAFSVLNMLERQLRSVHAFWKDKKWNGGPRFDFQNLKNPDNYLTPEEVYGRLTVGKRTQNDLVQLVHWFERGPIGLQEAAMRFLKKIESRDKEAEFLSQEETMALAEAFVNELNKGNAINRPLQLKKGGIWDVVALLQGWNVNEFRTVLKHFSRAVDPNTSKAILWLALGMFFVAPMLGTGGFGSEFIEWMARLFYRHVLGEERATRFPWEREGLKSQAIGWAISIANPIPFVQTIVNTMLNDMPNRASADPILFLQSKAIDMAQYVGGVVKTGDMTYGLPRLVKNFLPLSSVFINRMDGVAGSLEALDARRLMTRYGPQDMLKEKSSGAVGVATELTPFGEKMLNAAMEGNDKQFVSLYNRAVEKARDLGIANPERIVRQMYASRNPYDRAFKQKLDPDQREAFLSKLNPDERRLVDDVETRYRHAAGLIGAPANYDTDDKLQQPRVAAGGGAAGAAAGVAPVMASTGGRSAGGRSGRSGLSRGRGRGLTRGRVRGGARGRSVGLSRGLRRFRS